MLKMIRQDTLTGNKNLYKDKKATNEMMIFISSFFVCQMTIDDNMLYLKKKHIVSL